MTALNDDLQAEIDALRAENERLRADSAVVVEETPVPSRTGGGWWRGLISAICIILAGILVPVSIVGSWARAELVSEQSFVQTFAPLSEDPGVQALIIDQATTAINESVDIDGFTNDLFDGLASLDLPPRAESAIDLLRAPAVAGVQNLIDASVTRLVESDAFSAVWQRALLASHRALVATATGTNDTAISIDDNGELGINLGPIIDELKERLVDQGFGFASAIPAIDKTIVIAQADALVLVGTVYGLAVTTGFWLPFVALGLFAIGILVARRKATAILGTGIAMAAGAASLAISLTGAGTVLSLNAVALGIPAKTLDTIFFAVVGAMRDTAVVVTFLGIVIALSAWLSGRSEYATRVRTLTGSVTGGARGALRERGLNTGRFGQWLARQRILVRSVILILAIVLLFALRPLSIGDIVLTVVLALLVWLIAALLERRDVPGEPVEGLEDTAVLPDLSDDDIISVEAVDSFDVGAADTGAATDAATAPAAASPPGKKTPKR